jgi:hypothetical protein
MAADLSMKYLKKFDYFFLHKKWRDDRAAIWRFLPNLDPEVASTRENLEKSVPGPLRTERYSSGD